MKDKLRPAVWRFAIFTVVCLMGAFAVMAIFSQLRFRPETTYRAEFTNVTGLEPNNLVRIAGVEVGKVKTISIEGPVALVEFSADDTVVLTQGTRASIRWADPIGGRYLALEEGVGGVGRLNAGQAIPVDRTEPALDLDTLLGGFRPLFRALNPAQVNALSAQLIQAFQGEGATISSFLSQAAMVTNTLADRDTLVQQVIDNLHSVLGSLGDQSSQFEKAVDSLSELVAGLAARRDDISNAVAYTNAAAGTVADLLQQARPPFQNTVHQMDRTAGNVVADHGYFDNLLNTLPDTYKALSRLGIYGDYFTFYLCDLLLKVNGKGGQPVYIKLAEQASGRCTPK
ncbi:MULTISPECIES: MCE family protein [Mycolicibacterium]|uniref:Mce family protein Mce3B n=2 Tax=Mycolicibacterium TaxID=1866885 RepID=A0AAD1M4B9_9MYCO|nr:MULTISPECIES: MCE family protein [Mycolicibacterium]MCV7042456.1 MCE family protein [Mycolicibacterium moriokaense]MCV7058231.1 MCE family protein [Mycolicibacterium gilvum]ORB22949.1 mammalian cell entry protein [Mycolicibacterium moriokaense]STZ41142.1 virulence factor Mce family protein [Mycolicibacterium gilvum]BBW99129.1 Mce family protein Mce3B [Mycolicibacterium moriokaense]